MLSAKEKSEIEALSKTHPVVKKLLEQIEGKKSVINLRDECDEMLQHLATEMRYLRMDMKESCTLFTSDEKLLEKVNTVLLNSHKYFENRDKLSTLINPDDEAQKAKKGKVKPGEEPLTF